MFKMTRKYKGLIIISLLAYIKMLLLTGVVYAESLDEIVSQEVREDFKVNQEAEVIIYFNKLPEEVSFDQKVGSDESRKRTKQEIFDEYTSIKEK